MSSATRVNRKASNEDIVKLNSVGLPLSTIGKMLGCHPTSITLRLQSLGIEPADTRRSFMEGIYTSLTPDQQEWLATQLGPHQTIKDFVKMLLLKEFFAQNLPLANAA